MRFAVGGFRVWVWVLELEVESYKKYNSETVAFQTNTKPQGRLSPRAVLVVDEVIPAVSPQPVTCDV